MSNEKINHNFPSFIHEEINFERVRLAGRKYFGEYELAQMKFIRMEDLIVHALVYQWETMCKGEVLRNDTKKVTFKYPLNWWEHFKYERFPKWLLKRFPVRFKVYKQTVRFKEIAVFPKLSEVIPFREHRLDYMRHTECLNVDGTYDCDMNIMEVHENKSKNS